MSNKSEASTGGISFCGLLAIVFITQQKGYCLD